MAMLAIGFLLLAAWKVSEGYDPFESLLPGAPCFKPRTLTGCNGTLLSNFHPTARTASYSDPDTLFFLFTRRNRQNPEFLHECGGTLPTNTYFDPRQETKIIVPGYVDGVCRVAWMREMTEQLLIGGDYNVILVDWTWGNTLDVASPIINTRPVGQQIGFVLRNLIEKGNARPEDLHIIGHSFGSHIAGFAGKTVKNLGRITGLEPALPGFGRAKPEDRLNRHDAILVDVIHTSAAKCDEGVGFGAEYPWGDADFYVNGGHIPQPGCHSTAFLELLKLDVIFSTKLKDIASRGRGRRYTNSTSTTSKETRASGGRMGGGVGTEFQLSTIGPLLNCFKRTEGGISALPIACSHTMVINYYKVTINPGNCDYMGYECPSYESFQSGECERSCGEDGSRCAWMGLDFDKTFKNNGKHPRKFYLNTRIQCPYCMETVADTTE